MGYVSQMKRLSTVKSGLLTQEEHTPAKNVKTTTTSRITAAVRSTTAGTQPILDVNE